MPFCPSCGNETDPGQKFCGNCGLPLDQITPPPEPFQPSPPPPAPLQVSGTPAPLPPAPLPPLPPPPPLAETGAKKPVSKKTGFIIAAVAVIAIVAAIYGIGIPLMKGGTPFGTEMKATPSPIPVVTAVPPAVTGTTSTPPPTPVQKRDDRYEETYEQIYAKERDYKFGEREVFSQELTRPPLFIQFNITPSMVSREKLVDIGLSTEHNITAIYISPNAWFEVKVLDATTGAVVDKRGFNREYSVMTNQEFMVRTEGNYRIEMSGNDIFVSMKIMTGNP
ncbi:MAG: zinc ribbon domain-containing protein [Methanoregula sp.]|nr:zinc ribbon domain-containing protein [Methanoregula sp.]